MTTKHRRFRTDDDSHTLRVDGDPPRRPWPHVASKPPAQPPPCPESPIAKAIREAAEAPPAWTRGNADTLRKDVEYPTSPDAEEDAPAWTRGNAAALRRGGAK